VTILVAVAGESPGLTPRAMMEVNPESGVLRGVRFVRSPNCDARPAGTAIEVLIIHAISLPPRHFGGGAIEQLFCNKLDPNEHPYYQQICDLKVSAHLLIRRDGEIIQFVPFHLRAWHAGKSFCEGRERVNDFSVGIEIEGSDEDPFEPLQYATLQEVTRAMMRAYPRITGKRIYGHSDVAPGRKIDPGPHFDWARYLGGL
jgi:AmpD protein